MKVDDILFEDIGKANRDRLKTLKLNLCGDKSKDSSGKADQHNEWALCLGAGVSISAGLPDWYGLLARMTAQIFPTGVSFPKPRNTDSDRKSRHGSEEGENSAALQDEVDAFQTAAADFFKKLDEMKDEREYLMKRESAHQGQYKFVFENINVLESAEYIRNYIAQTLRQDSISGEAKEIVEKDINWHIHYFIQQICRSSLKYQMDGTEITETTLGAAARLLKSDSDSIIHDVITYNYDNLLEEYLRTNCGCNAESIHSVIKTDPLPQFGDRSAWNIYHVHGRIPVFENERESISDEVILTESDYYREERINYSWTNTLQSYVLSRANLIFIGFSGADYNFRRILKYINQDRSNAHSRYIFFSVDDIVYAVFSEEIRKGRCISECIQEMNQTDGKYAYEKRMINYLIHAKTIYWFRHGITVIWSSHEELPSDLDGLHLF